MTQEELREKYLAGSIFALSTIVEDAQGNKYKIINRGSNYLTLESIDGVTVKKWLSDVKEVPVLTEETNTVIVESEPEFTVSDGQIKMFGYQSKNFTSDLSECILEQFAEFDDTYSKHQIIKLLDLALQESDADQKYQKLDRVSEFYDSADLDEPLLVEAIKNEVERRRIAEIIASVANITPSKSSLETVYRSIDALKKQYKQKIQWAIITPLFKLAHDYGFTGVAAKLPFGLGNEAGIKEDLELDVAMDVFEEHIDLLFNELTESELETCYDSDDFISETLTIAGRHKLAIDMKRSESKLASKRKRAMATAGTLQALTGRARKMALNALKLKMFKKDPSELTRQEKERFEASASKRTALVARLAQRMLVKAREIQNDRLHKHHEPHHGHVKVGKAAQDIAAASKNSGAS